MIKKLIPNALTSANLFTGLCGIVFAFTGDYTNTIIFIFIAALFDFFDGFAARLLGVSGDFGKELDSLADVISFGALPSIYMFQLLRVHFPNEWIPFVGLLIGVFSAVRLAKFNLDTEQSDKFIGLPTPANAILITTLGQVSIWNSIPQGLIIVTILSCYLLVSKHEMIALKFKGFSFGDNWDKYILILIIISGIALKGLETLPFIIPLYILYSLIINLIRVQKSDIS